MPASCSATTLRSWATRKPEDTCMARERSLGHFLLVLAAERLHKLFVDNEGCPY